LRRHTPSSRSLTPLRRDARDPHHRERLHQGSGRGADGIVSAAHAERPWKLGRAAVQVVARAEKRRADAGAAAAERAGCPAMGGTTRRAALGLVESSSDTKRDAFAHAGVARAPGARRCRGPRRPVRCPPAAGARTGTARVEVTTLPLSSDARRAPCYVPGLSPANRRRTSTGRRRSRDA